MEQSTSGFPHVMMEAIPTQVGFRSGWLRTLKGPNENFKNNCSVFPDRRDYEACRIPYLG